MKFIETELQGLYIIEPRVFEDNRGLFFESFNERVFQEYTGIECDFVQDNHSYSTYGVLRGLHFQKGEHMQAKLVRTISGKVLDIVVDIRKESPTYGKSFSVELSAENRKQLFVPKGFAHGFVVLSDSAEFVYKCDTFYHPASESGIIYNDEQLALDWKVPEKDLIVSDKDLELPKFEEISLETC
ncbi:dTDP-4-dehydrorhamnose 3,5-epimerase [Rapidithrix thailandica]|uniref:dTDP-4-dehydrorhamnose 3,5-epimerase n=1 Tax=Rapidithrix thailandica TaxID=413964 RepID=A0AAW9S2R5_9BACT